VADQTLAVAEDSPWIASALTMVSAVAVVLAATASCLAASGSDEVVCSLDTLGFVSCVAVASAAILRVVADGDAVAAAVFVAVFAAAVAWSMSLSAALLAVATVRPARLQCAPSRAGLCGPRDACRAGTQQGRRGPARRRTS
jgi:hypothetical protein